MKFLLIILASLLIWGLVESDSTNAEPRMSYLGKIGQKSIYSDNDNATWNGYYDIYAARSECRKYGFQLLQLNTAEESAYFHNTIRQLLGMRDHWVDGLLDTRISIFTWGGNASDIVQPYVNYYYNSDQPQMCLQFAGVYNYLSGRPCTATGYSLCQRVE